MSFFLSLLLLANINIQSLNEEHSFIIEVENNPHQFAEEMKSDFPRVEILAVYDTIFNGVALKTDTYNLENIQRKMKIKQVYRSQTYQTQQQPIEANINQSIPFLLPEPLPFTGKGVKVGVIDTGIDHHHPDLQQNYQGGYDVVDFDNDPMETTIDQGMPTLHGTHVAGVIAANGKMKGVAPDAELYAYRALGPGGTGTSVQVMAAIEQAVKDGMDIINLSLGNTINGPDWPTSVAVNRATEKGVAVVIANGNTGPELWTVGSPATADRVISVGASTPALKRPYLYDSFQDKKIEMIPMQGSSEWQFTRDLEVTSHKEKAKDAILIIDRGKIPFGLLALEAEKQGAAAVLIANNEKGIFQGALDAQVSIPVAAISKEDGEWLKQHADYLKLANEHIQDTITDFSSRGPVTVNWAIKPEIVAPGASILSTVPNGYQALSGTSMAAPHIAGVLALLKEAHPNWTPKQLKAAILTTAKPFPDFSPTEQGAGKVDPKAAIETDTLVYQSLLQFGKLEKINEQRIERIVVENISDRAQKYSFSLPKQQQDIRFQLPQTFTLAPKAKKELEVKMTVRTSQLDQNIKQGYLYLNNIPLPYMFLTETAEIPEAMGLEFTLSPIDSAYQYQLYLVENAKKLTIDLYDATTFAFVTNVLELKEPSTGVIEGSVELNEQKGEYIANIKIEKESDETYDYQVPIWLE